MFTQPVDHSRSDGLDAFRFILAVWVMLAHGIAWAVYTDALSSESVVHYISRGLFWIFQRSGETHPAVLAFIVLSGYCIHRNGYRSETPFGLKEFAVRRSFRILPIYWVGTALGIFLWFLSGNFNLETTKALTATVNISAGCVAVKLTGIASFFPALFNCGFEGNAPLTTAIVETWLYVFYGFVVWYLKKGYAIRGLLIVTGMVWFFYFVFVLFNQRFAAWWHNGAFVSFLVYWWVGAFFAEYRLNSKKWILSVALLLVIAGFLGGGVDNLLFAELKKVGFSVFFAVTIVCIDQNWKKAPVLSFGGQSGYCIYAVHGPILVFLLVQGWSLWPSVTLILALSVLLHFIIEKPLLNFGRKLSINYRLKESS